MNRLDISVTLNDGQTVSLVLFGQEGTLFEISQEEAQAYGESCCQLVEGKSYEYGIDAGYHLEGEVVYSSRLNESTGILQTGNQVGDVICGSLPGREMVRRSSVGSSLC